MTDGEHPVDDCSSTVNLQASCQPEEPNLNSYEHAN